MKTKIFMLLVTALLFAITNYGQTITDSARTRNDKPGTPQSLRTSNTAPVSHVTILNSYVPQNQNVISSESLTPNNTNGKTVITIFGSNGNAVPKSSITLQTNPFDTTKKGPIINRVSNASNPLRNN
ncbi:MAG TPA: hypothetical protein VIM07_06460 [Chitinophagaceae bacterium]